MTTTPDDISFVYSGGSNNNNPNVSLGGDPSSITIGDNLINNLFADLTTEESNNGKEDYRCIYIFNDGDTPIFNLKIWLDDFTDGATLELGIEEKNETQRLTLSGEAVTGGSITLSFEGVSFESAYNVDLGQWAEDMQAQILGLVDSIDQELFFRDVTVTAQSSNDNTILFDIRFANEDGKRNWERFEIDSNDLEPLGDVDATVSALQDGSPINTIASEITIETTPPGSVGFFAPTEASPIILPRVLPTEGFPIWIKRVTPAGSAAKESDGFGIKFKAESVE